ncbi:MAG: YlbF family regulator [Acholeplasmatales bacterium]|nr:YlbF family regulator [Acholeplasmatales bacterium]
MNNKLLDYFNNIPEVIRLKELKNYIESNEKIINKFDEIKNVQKQIVNAKEFNQINQLKVYEDEYKRLNQELLDIPFVEEYLELMNYVDQMIKSFVKEVEYQIDKKING